MQRQEKLFLPHEKVARGQLLSLHGKVFRVQILGTKRPKFHQLRYLLQYFYHFPFSAYKDMEKLLVLLQQKFLALQLA